TKKTRRARHAGVKTLLAAAAAATAVGALATSNSVKASFTWDANGAAAGTGGSGTWTGGATWLDSSDTTYKAWIDNNDAILSPTVTATITLNATVTANSLTYANTANAYTISGSGTLNVPTITLNLGTTQTITSRIGGTGDL